MIKTKPSSEDSGLSGVFLEADGTPRAGQIPGANLAEAAAHELLGHVWADLVGGVNAGTQGNLVEALIAEDRVRHTDPSRGIKLKHQDDQTSEQIITPDNLSRITNPGNKP